jgi:hypothetical protein
LDALMKNEAHGFSSNRSFYKASILRKYSIFLGKSPTK